MHRKMEHFLDWYEAVLDRINAKITRLADRLKAHQSKKILTDPDIQRCLKSLQGQIHHGPY